MERKTNKEDGTMERQTEGDVSFVERNDVVGIDSVILPTSRRSTGRSSHNAPWTSEVGSMEEEERMEEEEDEEEEEEEKQDSTQDRKKVTWKDWITSPWKQTQDVGHRLQQSEFALVAILLQQRLHVVYTREEFSSYPSVRHWVNYHASGAPSGFVGESTDDGSFEEPKSARVSMVEVPDSGYLESKLERSMGSRGTESKRRKACPKVPLINATMKPTSTFSFLWAFVMLFTILIYVAFLLPITLTFSTGLNLTSWLEWVDTMFGFLFVVDMYIKFRTGFIVRFKHRVKLVMDPTAVAKYYLFSFVFIVDLLSVLPFFLGIVATITNGRLLTSSAFQAFKLFRLMRMAQFLSIVSSGSIGMAEAKAAHFFGPTLLYLLHVLYLFAMLANFCACLFLYTAFYFEDVDDSWLTSVNGVDLTNSGGPRQYLAGLYFAVTTVTTVGYGDVSAHTAVEEGICILVQFCGAVMFGYVTASLAVVLSTQSETAQRIHAYRDKIEYVSKWSDAAKLPHKLRRKVKESFQQHFIFQDSIDVSQMTVEIYGELSPSLKNEVAGTLMLPVLQELFPNLIGSGALQKIASNCKPCPAKRGVKVFNFGDTSDRVYFLRRGAIEVLDELDDTICHMMAPKIIGMMSSYVCQLNSEEEEGLHDIFLTTAQTLLDSDIWFIEKKMLDRLFDFYPDLESEMIAAIRTYIKHSPGLWRFLPEHLSVAQFKRSKERKPRATG